MILSFSSSSTANAALSATTANVIHGTTPYLTLDGGTTQTTTTEGLLVITLPNGTKLIPVANAAFPSAVVDTSSASNPIFLGSSNYTFEQIKTLLSLVNYPSKPLSVAIGAPNNYWGDGDGDHTPATTGAYTVKWEDNRGNDITQGIRGGTTNKLSICDSPYKLTVSIDDGTLSTRYGVPNTSDYTGSTHSYYFSGEKPTDPYICYVRPNLEKGDVSMMSGPWRVGQGFFVSDFLDLNTPSSNFPTTGSNNLFFDIDVYNTVSPITATKVSGSPNINITLNQISNNVRVTLKGPSESSGGGVFSPTTFALYTGSTKIYSFTIERWFIARKGLGGLSGSTIATSDLSSFCSSFSGYKTANIWDYMSVGGVSAGEWPPSPAQRDIGFSFVGEWGVLSNSYYTGSDWIGGIYWGMAGAGDNEDATVDMDIGERKHIQTISSNFGSVACVNN